MKPNPIKQRVAAHKKRKAKRQRVHAQTSALAHARNTRRRRRWGELDLSWERLMGDR